MINACTKTRFEQSVKERFEQGQSGIVMVMMARYTIDTVKTMLRENYEYWDIASGRIVDIYLAGYGAFLPNDNTNTDNKQVEGTNFFYNNRAFKTFKDALYSNMGLEYDDRIELFLLNYKNGNVEYSNALRIDVGASSIGKQEEIRRIMAFLIRVCATFSDVQSLSNHYKFWKAKRIAKSVFKKIVIDGVPPLIFSLLPKLI